MSCIYIIKHKDSDALYVGGTVNFEKRKIRHKSNCCNINDKNYDFKLYQFIRDNGGWERFDMWKIDCCDLENQKEKEQEYIDKFKPSLNNYRACGLDLDRKKETNMKRKENDKKKKHIWYENNKDRLKEYFKNEDRIKKRKEKFECPCGGKYTKEHKSHHSKTKRHIDYINSSP